MIKIAGTEFYQVEELAEMLRRDPQTIRAYLRKGQLKGRKVGRAWYVSAQAVKELLGGPDEPRAQAGAAE